MLKVSRSLPDIAVIRGGAVEFAQSLEEGAEVLKSLAKIGYKPLDVLADRDGNWTLQGLPTDAHHIFSRAHTVVDTTHDRNAPHVSLARRMGITLLFSRANNVHMDREDMYRLLRMQGFKVPDTLVVRASRPLEDSIFREVWSKYHTPLMVRPLRRHPEAGSKLITMYPEFETVIRDYHRRGIDVHILTYRKAPTSSMAVLPHFRGEKLYTPLWVEVFGSMRTIPTPEHPMRTHYNAPEYRKQQMREIAIRVYEALGLEGPACVDVVPFRDGYIVVNVDANPSLRKDGRFMQSLQSVGADIGQYVHAQIQKEMESSQREQAYESAR
jgi:D-alanine-D-alanine ligase-like ATP-grasp enzyme